MCHNGGCNRHASSVPANHALPPGSPSNSSKIFPFQTVTFSPTLRPRKSFIVNTYKSPRKCCKQTTYAIAKSFRCSTYEKQRGGGGSSAFSLPAFQRSKV